MKTINKKLIVLTFLALPTIALADPAVHINAFNCGLFDGNGTFVLTTTSRIVATQSDNNNVILKCMADVTPPNTGTAVKTEGFLCGGTDANGNSITTTDSREVVSASGEAVLTCKFKTP